LPLLQKRMQSEIAREFRYSTLLGILDYHFGWDRTATKRESGKRLRPLILFLSMEACGGSWKAGLPAACAIEFLHNYSLIHDDIEDQDEYRHGRKTVWQKYGLAEAINAGDALYGLAFLQMKYLPKEVRPEKRLSIFKIFSKAATQLTIGQAADIDFEDRRNISLEEYWRMVKGKTAALFQASTEIGSYLGEADKKTITAFSKFGLNLGLAFQARDDLLGIWGDPKDTGKPTGSDLIKKKKSLPICFGLQKDSGFRRLYALEESNTTHIQNETQLLAKIGAYDFTLGEIMKYSTKARSLLTKSGNKNIAVDALLELTDSLNVGKV
jgi:geranylgeranyl diphosphate synthase, type I